MRLLIAGILTLAIHLLVSVYGKQGEEVPDFPDTPVPVFHLPVQSDFQMLRTPPHLVFFTVTSPPETPYGNAHAFPCPPVYPTFYIK